MKLLLLLLTVLLATEKSKADECTLCYDGETPDLAKDSLCTDAETNATTFTAGSDECLLNQMTAYQLNCCKQTPTGLCPICEDYGTFTKDKAVPNPRPGAPDQTCEDLNGDSEFLEFINEPGKCDDTLLRRSASWCGCETAPTTSCTLCPDGSKHTNVNKVEKVIYGWDCEFFEFVATFFSGDECSQLSTGEVLNIDAPAFCGCPNVPTPSSCKLCPKDSVLREGLDLGEFTCGELAESTGHITNANRCIGAKTTFRLPENDFINKCCCEPEKESCTSGAASGVAIGLSAAASILFSLLFW